MGLFRPKAVYPWLFVCFVLFSEFNLVADSPVIGGTIPIGNFSSAHDNTYSVDDLVRIELFSTNSSLTAITNFPDADIDYLRTTLGKWNNDPRASQIISSRMGSLVSQNDAEKALKKAIDSADGFANGRPHVSEADALQFINYSEPSSTFPQAVQDFVDAHIRLRQGSDQLSLPSISTNVTPAVFSFARDFQNKSSVWNAVGALGYSWNLVTNNSEDLSLLPNVGFDRVSGAKSNNTDSLVFQLPVNYTKFDVPSPLVQSYAFRLAAVYSTDFEFESSQIGGQLEAEPLVATKLLLGNSIVLPRPGIGSEFVLLTPRMFLHFEGGDVLSAGGNPNLKDGRAYLRLGPNIQLQLTAGRDLPALRNFALTAAWQEYEALISDTVATRLFSVQGDYKLTKNLDINVQYRNGRQPLTTQKVEAVTVGLGLRF